ncbi:MAG TPA: POTRA domain-containing protein, partial [Polyangiaceae bacterium]
MHRERARLLSWAAWLRWLVLCGISLGCTRAPTQRFNLESLKVSGNEHIDDDELEARIASRQTPKFLGLFPGVIYDYEVFNRFVLERDLQRIERMYRARGYYEAHARAAHVFRSGAKVRVEIVIEEGAPVLLRRVDVHGIQKLPADLQQRARRDIEGELPLGAPLEEEKLAAAAKALARALGDSGYAQAVVRKSADVNLPQRVAAVGFWVDAGRPAELGEIKLEGLQDLPEERVRRALDLEPGASYSQSELDEAKRALLDLGVFSSVEIEPQLDAATTGASGKARVPILVRVEKAKLRAIRVGGGVLIDTLKSDVHLTFGWENQSFLGGMRKLELEAVPGAVIYPTRFPSFEAPQRLLPHARLRSEFRQPGFPTGRSNLLLKGQVAAYPVLLTNEPDTEAPILGYLDYRASVGVERTYYRFYSYLSQNLQINDPFVYKGE